MLFKQQTSRLLSVKDHPSHLLHRSFTEDEFFWNAYGYEFFSVRLRIQSCTLWIIFRTVTVKLVTVPEYFSARLRFLFRILGWNFWQKRTVLSVFRTYPAGKNPVVSMRRILTGMCRMWRMTLHTYNSENKYVTDGCEGVKDIFGKTLL